MKTVLPWLIVFVLAVGLGWQLTVTQKAQSDVNILRNSVQEVETLRAEIEQRKQEQTQAGAELEKLRNDNKELLRLRNDVAQLRQEKQQLTKQIQTAQAQTQAAQEQAQAAQQQTQVMQQQAQLARQLQAQVQPAAGTAADAISKRPGITLTPEGLCATNLRQIESAKQRWAQENNAVAGTMVGAAELAKYLNPIPGCPGGGTYTFGAIGAAPTCSIQGHVMK